MKKLLFYFTGFIFIIHLAGCNRDDIIISSPVNTTTTDGAYILSEGIFNSPGTSKLSFYSLQGDTIDVNIFNPGSLGNTPDGLILFNKNLFITEQGNTGVSGKIYETDTNGTVILSNDAGINPYSLAIANNKIYLTNGPTNNVSVVDMTSLATTSTINVGIYPQEIMSVGNKVFVCNTSIYMGPTDSTVSVIDAVSDAVIAIIKVRQAPSSLAVTNDGKLLVGCPGNPAQSVIYKIDPDTYSKLDSFELSNGLTSGFDKDISVDKNSNDIYFISNSNNIEKLNLNTKASSTFISNPNTAADFFHGYNFDSKNKRHYIADAKQFVTNGSISIFDGNGTLQNTFLTGFAPRRIVVKK